MDVKKFIAILKNHYKVVSDEELAESLYMTQPAITHWKRRGIPKKVLKRFANVIEEFEGKGETINVKNKDIPVVKEGSKVEMGADYIIELQKDKIETQAKEIKELKELVDKKQAESTHWEALECDFVCNVTLFRDGLKFGRLINSVTDFDKQSQVLGYRVDEIKKFWDIGKKHPNLASHPIEAIINEETSKDIKKRIATFPIIFDAMKSVVGNHYISEPIIYKHKNGSNVGAIAYNKVNWRKMEVTSKVKFLVSE